MSIQSVLNFGKMKLTQSAIFDIDSRITDIVIELSHYDCDSFHDALLVHRALLALDSAANYLFTIHHDIVFPPKSE